jgi:hypothetical protein
MRQPARCVAPNAFRVRYAVWKLFLEPLLPFPPPRSFVSVSSGRTIDTAASALDEAKSFDKEPNNVSIKYERTGTSYKPLLLDLNPIKQNPPGENLRNALQRVRIKNRESLVKHIGTNTPTSFQIKRPDHPDLKPWKRAKLLSTEYKRDKEAPLVKDVTTNISEGHILPVAKWLGRSQSETDSAHSHGSESTEKEVKSNGNLATSEVLEYRGSYVLPTMKNTTLVKNFPWMKGQEGVWGLERLIQRKFLSRHDG